MRQEPDTAEAALKALMLAGLAGDGAAYRALLSRLTPYLRGYFARRLSRAAEAEDLVQETLIAIHTKRASFDQALPFTAWLHAIARYKLIDHLRKSGIRATLPLEEAEAVFGESDSEAAEASRDVRELLAKLPDAKRILLEKVKLEGLSTAEAALSLGMSESAVKVGVHRSLKALMKLIGGRDD
ncbi:RNA polymerase sigma-70 factor (ECF subfamily) [Rhizomicrobium palustre]|uniref:RNA polymerase sigma-70 factor (ECF subfamily) n=1 Tax=Rhizomicrobium palustre TaxID=189966 RepID=A0A846MWH0_9PROT|nr:sigma-70 family RNA polymerase sigma factor [Rhizomicrobium palustre]NIK87693.1 RNA polymerase sigma-70 factor (ECF subfamily) [Rhizomicrobium palustre]